MNPEGYKDPTAEKAVARVMKEGKSTNVQDKTAAIAWLMHTYRSAANDVGLEIVNRIVFRDKRTGEEYR